MDNLNRIKGILKEHQQELKNNFFVEKIGIFGSYSRNEEDPESDIDILVEFNGPIGWDFIELNDFLEKLLNKKVDLVSINALKPQFKTEILHEVVYI
ncbi:MAG: nucleotidyltransferase family protein [Candidatus Lokiarchaeota archaeon]|nr:nucleotidyltransferase family protein [Candidatus Lokiarchaeota archaeon]